MPKDRVEDSYAIYSQLLKSGPIEWRYASRKQWLIENTTNAIRGDIACHPASGADPATMSPYNAVEVPANRRPEWNEVLSDYDRHCHDVIRLDRNRFRTELPVHLLNAEDKRTLMNDPLSPPPELADGAGLHRFTEVFFNAEHTLALVEQGMVCGNLCGNWAWVVLERIEGRWEILPWVRMLTVS